MTRKALKGFEGVYSVTVDGKIYSHHLKRFKKTKANMHGREVVYLGRTLKQVSRLVALTFVPNPENKPQVNHIDGNKLNNHADNLEWMTAKENHVHAWLLGLRTKIKAERNGNSIFTWDKVRNIRELYATGQYSQAQLSRIYNCHQTNILKIVRHKTWIED